MTSMRNPFKSSLRIKMTKVLEEMSPESRKIQSERIAEKVMALPQFKNAERISIYLSTETEVATHSILEGMFRLDKKVFVPTYKGKRMEMVRLNDMEDFEELTLSKWNIKQPDINDDRENALDSGLHLMLIPGVAFTENGGRLGHGMGYYDTYLRRLIQQGPIPRCQITLIGLAFKEQMLSEDEVPMEEHDCFLDLVVSSD